MNTLESKENSNDQRLINRLKETGRCTWLLAALVMLLLTYPFAGQSVEASLLVALFNSAMLIAAAFASGVGRRTRIISFLFAVPAIVLTWMWMVGNDQQVALLLLAVMILFYGFTIAHVMAYVLSPGAVTGNKLHGAMSAYIMVGLLWSFVYLLIEVLVPESFLNMASNPPSTYMNWPQFMFFSFTTLTSTGYGNIVPVEGFAQSAAILEQLAGMFFVAVLIARLAGLYQPGNSDQTPPS